MDWSTAISAGQLGAQGLLAYKQYKRADELRRKGLKNITPAALKESLIAANNLSNSGRIAGYDKAMDNIDAGVSTAIGEGKRAAGSSSEVLSLLSKINKNRNQATNQIEMAGNEAKERRLMNEQALKMQEAGYQEQSRQERDEAIGALEGSAIQNANNILTGAVGLTSLQSPTSVPDYSGIQEMDAAEVPMNTGADYSTPDRVVNQVPVPTGTTELTDYSRGMVPQNDPTSYNQYLEYMKKQRLSR